MLSSPFTSRYDCCSLVSSDVSDSLSAVLRKKKQQNMPAAHLTLKIYVLNDFNCLPKKMLSLKSMTVTVTFDMAELTYHKDSISCTRHLWYISKLKGGYLLETKLLSGSGAYLSFGLTPIHDSCLLIGI